MFVTVGHFQPNIIFQTRLELTQMEPFTGLQYKVWLLALPAKISLGWKLLKVTNSLAYYETKLVATVKSFHGKIPVANVIKLLRP